MNNEQRAAVRERICYLEDDIARCKMELGRGCQSASEKSSLADRIGRAEDSIAKLKVSR